MYVCKRQNMVYIKGWCYSRFQTSTRDFRMYSLRVRGGIKALKALVTYIFHMDSTTTYSLKAMFLKWLWLWEWWVECIF